MWWKHGTICIYIARLGGKHTISVQDLVEKSGCLSLTQNYTAMHILYKHKRYKEAEHSIVVLGTP